MVLKTTNAIDEMGGIWEGGKQVLGEKAIAIHEEIAKGLVPDENGFYTLADGSMVQYGQGLVDGSANAVTTLTETMINDLNTILGEQGKQVAYDNGQYIVSGLAEGTEKSSDILKAASEHMAKTLNDAFETAENIGSPSKVYETYGQYIVEGFNNGITAYSATTQAPIEAWATSINSWFDGAGAVGKVNATTFQQKASDIVNGFVNGVNTYYTESQAAINTWTTAVVNWFTGNGSAEDKMNKTAFDKYAHNTVQGFATGVTNYYHETQSPTETWVKDILAWFTGSSGEDDGFINKTTWTKFAENVVTGFKETISSKYTETQSPIEEWAKSVVRWFNFGEENPSPNSGMGQRFFEIGDNAIRGLIEGLRNRLAELREVCEEIANAMEDAMEEATEEHSPSKSWARIGSYLVEGLAVGMEDSLSLAKASTLQVASVVDATLKPRMEAYQNPTFNIPVNAKANIDSATIASGMTEAMALALSANSDEALMREQNELLTRIADKDTNVYMNSKKVGQGIRRSENRSGYNFRGRIATT